MSSGGPAHGFLAAGVAVATLLLCACHGTSTDLNCGEPTARVGGDVLRPIALFTPDPEYTEEAAAARVQGVVILEAVIDCVGRVTSARVLKPLPFGLSEKAVEAVLTWRFEPATLHGRPVAVYYNLIVNFRLD